MSSKPYLVRAEWDSEAECWVAESDDVPGLATGAETMEELVRKLQIVVPELLEENGLLPEPHDTSVDCSPPFSKP